MDGQEIEAQDGRPAELIIPRLDLDISEDESAFDHINKMFSIENQNHLMEIHSEVSKQIYANSERRDEKKDLCSMCSADITSKSKDSPLKRIDRDSSDRQTNYKAIVLNHLELLDSLEDSEEGGNGKIKKTHEFALKKQWIRNKTGKVGNLEGKGQIGEDEILKLSMQTLERYFTVLSFKASELNRLTKELCSEMSNNCKLRETIVEYEKRIAEMAGPWQEKSKQNNEQHRSHMDIIKETKKLGVKFGVRRSQAEVANSNSVESRLRSKHSLIKVLKQPSHEKKRLQRIMQNAGGQDQNNFKNNKVGDLDEHLKEMNKERPRAESEIRQLNQNDLRESNSRYGNEKTGEETLREEKNNIVNEKSSNIIRYLREELTLTKMQLKELQERYDDQLVIAKIFKNFLSEIAGESGIMTNKWFTWLSDKLERRRAECGSVNEVKTEDESDYKSLNYYPTSNIKSQSLTAVNILRIEDIWEEQILCYESNIEKMKEVQTMRKTLIKTRQQLEKMIETNLKLRETIKGKKIVKENQLKGFCETGDLRLALVKKKREANLLSKELQQCYVIQKNNEKEIEMLNVSAKSKNTKEYCIVTTESMENFKTQIQKLRKENSYLLNYIDRMEEKMNQSEREMEKCKAINNDLKEWRKFLSKRCVELKVDVNTKTCSVRELKELVRKLKIKNEHGKEEVIDQRYEFDLCRAKLEKAEQRLSQMEELNMKLENDNSTIREKLFKTHYDLQKSLDMIYEMNLRFKNVDEKFKNNEEEIKSLSDDLVERENEIRSLIDSKKMTEVENEKLRENWDNIKSEKERLEAELENRNEQDNNESTRLTMKLANAEHEFIEEENNTTEKLHDFAILKREIKQFKNKMKILLGVSDLNKIEKEIKKLKEKEIILCKESNDLKSMREDIENKSRILQNQVDELQLHINEIEEENCQIYDELKLKEKEKEFMNRLLRELKIKLGKQSRYLFLR